MTGFEDGGRHDGEAGSGFDASAGGDGSRGYDGHGQGGGEELTSRLLQQFENFRDDVTSRFDALEERRYDGADFDDDGDVFEDDAEDYDAHYEDEAFDAPGTGHGELPPDLEAAVVQQLQGAAAEVRASREERAQAQREAYADHLEHQFPALQDPDVQNEVLERAEALAGHLAQKTGRPELAELAREPEWIEEIYLASEARKHNGAARAGQQDVQLETGGSASPATPANTDDALGDRIVKAGQSRRFRLGAGG